MRIVDENGLTISNYTPDMGDLIPTIIIREDAEPIDDVTKFAWADDDYEEAMMCIPHKPETMDRTPQDDTDSMLVDLEYRVTLLELGLMA